MVSSVQFHRSGPVLLGLWCLLSAVTVTAEGPTRLFVAELVRVPPSTAHTAPQNSASLPPTDATSVTPAGGPHDSPRNLNHAVWTRSKDQSKTARPPIRLVQGYSRYPFGAAGSHGRYPAGTPYYQYGPSNRPGAIYVPRQYGAALSSTPVTPTDPLGTGSPITGAGGLGGWPVTSPNGHVVGPSPLGFPSFGPTHVLPFGYGWSGIGWGANPPVLQGWGGYGPWGAGYGPVAYGPVGYGPVGYGGYGPYVNWSPIAVPYYYQYAW
jgi:hypothetical protein